MRNGPHQKDQHSNASRSHNIIMMEAANVALILLIASQHDEHNWPLGLHNYQTTIRGLFCFTSRVIMNITASERHCGLVGAHLLSVIRWFTCDYATTMFASDFKANIHHRRSSEMSRDIYSVGVLSPREPGKCRTWAALNPLCAGEDRITLALPLTRCKSARGVTSPSTRRDRKGRSLDLSARISGKIKGYI